MNTTRHYGMDWLRIAAFGLLILYHIGMFFVPWGWHVKIAQPLEWVEFPMLATNSWRLALLFLVSGYASAALFAKLGGSGAFARSRSARLLIPLLFFAVMVAVRADSGIVAINMMAALALGATYAGFREMWQVINQGNGTLHLTNFFSRAWNALVIYLTQRTTLKTRRITSLFHLGVVWGFTFYFVVNVGDLLEGFPTQLFVTLAGVTLLAGMCWGVIYERTKSLALVTASHWLLGMLLLG